MNHYLVPIHKEFCNVREPCKKLYLTNAFIWMQDKRIRILEEKLQLYQKSQGDRTTGSFNDKCTVTVIEN